MSGDGRRPTAVLWRGVFLRGDPGGEQEIDAADGEVVEVLAQSVAGGAPDDQRIATTNRPSRISRRLTATASRTVFSEACHQRGTQEAADVQTPSMPRRRRSCGRTSVRLLTEMMRPGHRRGCTGGR